MEIKNIVLVAVFIFGLVYMQFIRAETVDEIISRYVEARGGKGKLNSMTSVHMEGLRQMMGNEMMVKVTNVHGKLYRNEFEFGGVWGYTIITPFAGWLFIPMRSKSAEAIPEDLLNSMQINLDITGPLVDYAAKGNKVKLAGKENIDGRDSYKIKVTSSTGKKIIYFLDTKDYLLIRTKQITAGLEANQNEREIVTDFKDYKPVDGIMFPHTVITTGEGLGAGSTIFNKIELNRPVEENWYKPSV